jgi:3-keto-disaccharide hydrolase
MKVYRIVFAIAVASVCVSAAVHSLAAAKSKTAKGETVSAVSALPDATDAYLGRWDLTLKAPDGEHPSWLELSRENGELKARFVGRWGNARPLPKAEIANGQLTFVSPKQEEDTPDDMVFTGKLTGTSLSGTIAGVKDAPWTWTGRRAPALKAKNIQSWGKPISLFNGKDLTGWHMSGNGTPPWTVQNGNLVSPGNGPEIISDSKFKDFKLHVEFNAPEDSNSGVYLRGRCELQIETESGAEPPNRRVGSIYGFIAPSPEPPRKPGEWQTYDVTLNGRWVSAVQNGVKTIDNKEIPGITGGALDSHEELPGPIYLQGSEKGHVAFRNLVITPAKD